MKTNSLIDELMWKMVPVYWGDNPGELEQFLSLECSKLLPEEFDTVLASNRFINYYMLHTSVNEYHCQKLRDKERESMERYYRIRSRTYKIAGLVFMFGGFCSATGAYDSFLEGNELKMYLLGALSAVNVLSGACMMLKESLKKK